jgi:hypothetical protein
LIALDELAAARANMRAAQNRFKCFPACSLVVSYGEEYSFRMHQGGAPLGDNVLRCYLPDLLLRDILDRKVHWNNAEIGCLIRFNRVGPYMPDVHTLMSFFHLPKEKLG